MTETLTGRLAEAQKNQNSYTPNESIARSIGSRILVKLIGPTADGKSTLINAASRLSPDFSPVLTTTLQEGQNRSEPHYRYLDVSNENMEALLADIESGAVVQYAVHAQTGAIYATYPDGYRTKYNLLATLYHASEGLDTLPFAHTQTVGVIAPPEAWQQWIETRRGEVSPQKFMARLDEGQKSLRWLIEHAADIKWLLNTPGRVEETAQELIDIARGTSEGLPAETGAEAAQVMLNTIKRYADACAQETL